MEAKYQLEAREDGIDISIDIIGYAAVDVFHAAMKNAGLNERQILKCKDLRKRMRNRVSCILIYHN